MKGAAQFFLDTLVEDPTHHWLVTCPSASPENGIPRGTGICAGPTMDLEILRDLFANCIQASEILGADEGFREQLAATARRGWLPCKSAAPANCRNGSRIGTCSARSASSPRFASLRAFSQRADRVCGTPEFAAAAKKVAGNSRRQVHRLGHRLAYQPVGPSPRRRSRLRILQFSAQPRPHLPGHVRRAPAVPNRRQFRRRVGHRRDAAPKPGRRN